MIFKSFSIGVFLSVLSFQTIKAQGSYNQLVFEGNRSFNNKNYEGSSLQFKKATELNSKDFTAQYNLGNSYFKSKKFDEARTAYQRAEKLAKNNNDKAAALYNIGNTYMKDNNPVKAAEFFKQSLKNDPYNEQIRKNYEIAKLKKKEQEDKQNQKNSGKGGGNDKNKDQQDQPGNDPKQQDGTGKNSNSSDEGEGSNKSNQPKKNEGNLPKELEEAMLNRATNKERETAQKILNKNSFSLPQSNEKDW